MTISTLPEAPTPSPSRSQTQSIFSAAMEAFMAFLGPFISAFNVVIGQLNSLTSEIESSAATASAASALALATASASLYNAGTAYTQWQAAISAVNGRLYRRTVAGTGGPDPANVTDGSWVDADLPYQTLVTNGGSVTMTPGLCYRYTTGTSSPLLPSNPATGLIVGPVSKTAVTAIVTVMRNGSTINGVADNVLIDLSNRDFYFRCIGTNAWEMRGY